MYLYIILQIGLLAGLEKVKLLREPEAAALAYGLNLHQQQLVLVFDLGGGTLDVSVLEVGNGFVEVIATNGDSHLGGDDFDYIIVQWIIDKFIEINKEGGLYIRKDIKTYTKLREIAQLAKKDLSISKEVIIHIPCLYKDIDFPPTKLTRGRFESLSKSLLTRALKPLREVAIMAGILIIDTLILYILYNIIFIINDIVLYIYCIYYCDYVSFISYINEYVMYIIYMHVNIIYHSIYYRN